MNHLNSILIEGNVVHDPETENGVCKFVIASDRFYTVGVDRKKEVSFFAIVVIGKLAEVCGEYLKKGRGVRVVGRLEQEQSTIKIIADHVEFKPEIKK